MAGAAGSKTRSSSNNNAGGLINIYNNISKIVYRYMYIKRSGMIYEAVVCVDEGGDCESVAVHGLLIDYEGLPKEVLGDEAVINGRSVIYYQWDPCRSRRYLMIIAGGDLDG
jgi:hypothetical protein